MFEHYTENAKKATFLAREEATKVGASCVEPEHILLGIIRSCEIKLERQFNLKEIEAALREQVEAMSRTEASAANSFIPLSNQSKRSLAYAAEEAFRTDSSGIGTGHLLLGILREPENMASRFLIAHSVDLSEARKIVATLSQSDSTVPGQSTGSAIGLATAAKLQRRIGTAVQIAVFILFGIGVAKTTIAGTHLLTIAAIWFISSLAWHTFGPSSFGLMLGKRSRATTAMAYGFMWLYQFFMLGWLFPLGFGIYRVTTR
jgi:ATP-dependent Clp protease ATP-binding subunit ClpA